MKKLLKRICIIALIFPIIFLCSCSKVSKLPSINVSTYFENTVETSVLGNNVSSKEITLASLTAKKPNPDFYDRYVQFTLTGNGAWLYKMYIDKITFYVYTNKTVDTEMIINFSITNVADEGDLKNPEEFSFECSFNPKKNGKAYCEISVNKVIATATSCEIKFDITNSTSGTITDNEGNVTDFKWQIYGLKIYGESRSYS